MKTQLFASRFEKSDCRHLKYRLIRVVFLRGNRMHFPILFQFKRNAYYSLGIHSNLSINASQFHRTTHSDSCFSLNHRQFPTHRHTITSRVGAAFFSVGKMKFMFVNNNENGKFASVWFIVCDCLLIFIVDAVVHCELYLYGIQSWIQRACRMCVC